MFSKTPTNPTHGPDTQAKPDTPAGPSTEPLRAAPQPGAAGRPQKLASLIANDMTLEGNISGGGEIQIDGVIKGDVRVERVTVGDAGAVDGGIYAEAVEVRGKVSGSITAKQVRLYGACHVDGDITHEQLAMETGAFFQGRSLRLQRPATITPPAPQPSTVAQAPKPEAKPEPAGASHSPSGNGSAAKPSPAP
jgi:cytoskeletal protein CcmA (bactofilin family)